MSLFDDMSRYAERDIKKHGGAERVHRVQFEIPTDLHMALKFRTAMEGMTIKEFITELMADELAPELKQSRTVLEEMSETAC